MILKQGWVRVGRGGPWAGSPLPSPKMGIASLVDETLTFPNCPLTELELVPTQ